MDFHMNGPGEGREAYVEEAMGAVKHQFARWIHAKPTEVAFVPNTKAGEWTVFNGLDIQRTGSPDSLPSVGRSFAAHSSFDFHENSTRRAN